MITYLFELVQDVAFCKYKPNATVTNHLHSIRSSQQSLLENEIFAYYMFLLYCMQRHVLLKSILFEYVFNCDA